MSTRYIIAIAITVFLAILLLTLWQGRDRWKKEAAKEAAHGTASEMQRGQDQQIHQKELETKDDQARIDQEAAASQARIDGSGATFNRELCGTKVYRSRPECVGQGGGAGGR